MGATEFNKKIDILHICPILPKSGSGLDYDDTVYGRPLSSRFQLELQSYIIQCCFIYY